MDLQVKETNHRLILGGENFDSETNRSANQKEGFSYLTGISATIQKKLGLAEDIKLGVKIYTINKKSRNKWLARTTSNLEVKTMGTFSKNHLIMNQAIQKSDIGRSEILSNHVFAQTSTEPVNYQGNNLTVDNLTMLFQDEILFPLQGDLIKKKKAREEHFQAIRESATNRNARTIDTSHIEEKDVTRLGTIKQEITAARNTKVLARFKEAVNKVRVLGQVAALTAKRAEKRKRADIAANAAKKREKAVFKVILFTQATATFKATGTEYAEKIKGVSLAANAAERRAKADIAAAKKTQALARFKEAVNKVRLLGQEKKEIANIANKIIANKATAVTVRKEEFLNEPTSFYQRMIAKVW